MSSLILSVLLSCHELVLVQKCDTSRIIPLPITAGAFSMYLARVAPLLSLKIVVTHDGATNHGVHPSNERNWAMTFRLWLSRAHEPVSCKRPLW